MHDAIIIGGGPAGSTTATYLSRAGYKVLVLEKEQFPRFHIGESLLPYNMPVFEEMGVLPELEAAGFMVKRGAQFALGNGGKQMAVQFGRGRFTEHPQALQVERSKFDDILLRHAEATGVEVREGCPVKDYRVEKSRVVVNTPSETHEARFLIDATGVCNLTGTRERLREPHAKLRKLAIFGHFTGVEAPTGENAGDIVIVRLDDAWFWMIPLTAERSSIGLVVDQADFRSSGKPPQDYFRARVDGSDFLRERMAAARPAEPLRTMVNFSYRNRSFVSPRLVRVGDAAGFLDPIFSSGVYLAMISGRDAAGEIAGALARDQAMTRGLRRYERRLTKKMSVYWNLIERFYTHAFVEVLVQPEAYFHLPCALNAILAGRLDGSFSVRWRLRLFFWLTALQKRVPVVPRVSF